MRPASLPQPLRHSRTLCAQRVALLSAVGRLPSLRAPRASSAPASLRKVLRCAARAAKKEISCLALFFPRIHDSSNRRRNPLPPRPLRNQLLPSTLRQPIYAQPRPNLRSFPFRGNPPLTLQPV